MEHVWLDVVTQYGSTSVQVTKRHYELAVSAPNNVKTKSRDTICIRVREKLNKAGAKIGYLGWEEVTISSTRCQKPVPQQCVQTPEELFLFVAPGVVGNYQGENPCGCVP